MARSPRPPGDDDDDDGEGPEWEDPSDVWREFLEPVNRLSRDMRQAAATLGPQEVRHLVDAYYIMQDDRKRAAGQERSLDKSGEPHSIISWLLAQSGTLEKQLKGALDVYTDAHVMGGWMRQVHGIGPVLSAGLLAHIDMEKSPTVGHIWAFAGIAGDGQKPWEAGERRPFNAKLKVLTWKCGQSFMKFSNSPKCFYGQQYRIYKAKKVIQNDSGGYKDRAAEKVRKASPKYKKTQAYQHNLKGFISPGHVDALARRWAVKLFLAHLHGEWHERHFGRPPVAPYPIAHLGHAHVIRSPVPPTKPRPSDDMSVFYK